MAKRSAALTHSPLQAHVAPSPDDLREDIVNIVRLRLFDAFENSDIDVLGDFVDRWVEQGRSLDDLHAEIIAPWFGLSREAWASWLYHCGYKDWL